MSNIAVKEANSQYFNISVKDMVHKGAFSQQRVLSEIWKATELAVKDGLQSRVNEKAALIQQQINFAGVAMPGDRIEIIIQTARMEQEMEVVIRLQKKTKSDNTAIAGARLVYYVYNA